MNNSNFATTTYDGDAMDIDTPSTNGSQTPRSGRRPDHSRNALIPITRHVFRVPINFHRMDSPATDLQVLSFIQRAVRSELGSSNTAVFPDVTPLGERRAHLMIMIGTEHRDRMRALNEVSRRLEIMIQMSEDGLGWLNPLPYHHPHFRVQLLRGRRLGR